MEQRAARQAGEAVAGDVAARGRPITPEEEATAQRAGTSIIVGDTGPQTRTLAQGVSNLAPQARETLKETTDQRFFGQSGRISDFIRGLTGGEKFADATAIREAARRTNRPAYERGPER